jgi:F-type H+-transporting ATPase subunit epsilon
MPEHMRLRILLPYAEFADHAEVLRLTVETSAGSLGLLPRRLDCAVPLVPGILMFQRAGGAEEFVAVDEGILVKTGPEVRISVRDAVGGVDLGGLREAVRRRQANLGEAEKSARTAIARLESDFVRRFIELKHAR